MEVMKIMATSFKRPHAGTATLSSRDPAAGHHRTTPPLETPRHSRASLCRLLWGHCPFLRGPGKHKVLFVPSKALFPQLYVSSAGCMLGLWLPPPNGLMPHSDLLKPEPLPCSSRRLTHTSAGGTQTQSCLISVGYLGPGLHKVCLSL